MHTITYKEEFQKASLVKASNNVSKYVNEEWIPHFCNSKQCATQFMN
jgi:hypothetical protein